MERTSPEHAEAPLAMFIPQTSTGEGAEFRVQMPIVRIGQGARNEIALDDDTVSSKHALLEYLAESWRITDLESRNGTYVEGVRLAPGVPTPLSDGVVVSIGAVKLRFRVLEGADPARASAAYTPPEVKPARARRSALRMPLWLALLIVLILAALVMLFLSFQVDPQAAELTVAEPVPALEVAPPSWIAA